MKWFLPITAATCAAAIVVMLALALAETSSPTRGDDTLSGAPWVCIGEPSWFIAIHKSYDCNPKITPDFNFAALYSGVLPRETILELAALAEAEADRGRGGRDGRAQRIASLPRP